MHPSRDTGNPPTSVARGRQYEQLARQFLRRQGLRDIRSNFHSRYGEIDIIARDGAVMVFAEVRYRQSNTHGGAIASVTRAKQQKILQTARYFLQINGLTNRMPCRFDVIGITGSKTHPQFHWIKNAF